jgi:uncharacterized protein YjbJ (UPF0337 family)
MGAISDKITGTAKKIEGKLTGDKLRTAQGTAQKAKGDVEGAISRVAGKVKAGVRNLRARARARTR